MFGVFAKQNIRQRTQFGPVEGIVRSYDGSLIQGLPFLFKIKNENKFLHIDISDESRQTFFLFSVLFFFFN